MIPANMNFEDMLNEVQKLRGSSYTFMNMIDDGNAEMSELIKTAQAKEFPRVAKIHLYVQQKMQQERKQPPEINEINVEFKDFQNDSFLPINLTEKELADIIIDIKIEDIEVEQSKQERCAKWVLNHSKY